MTPVQESISIRDVCMRDGLQDLKRVVPTNVKLDLAVKLYDAGVRWLEATSFVSATRVPQLADAERLCGELRLLGLEGLTLSAFAATRTGALRALAAEVDEISMTVPATDATSEANFGRTSKEMLQEVLSAAECRKRADMAVTISVAFSCPFEGPVPPERVLQLVEPLVIEGYSTIFLGDTNGMATPTQVSKLVQAVADEFPDTRVGCHFHDARGAGIANVLAAIDAGCTAVDSSLGGLGGCPFIPEAAGNVPTEDVVSLLSDMGFSTGVDPTRAARAALWMADALDVPLKSKAPGLIDERRAGAD